MSFYRVFRSTVKCFYSQAKEGAEQVARDLETLTAEATSKEPRRKWWELSIEGLKDAAKNIGEIGKPVLELATRIVAILSGLPVS